MEHSKNARLTAGPTPKTAGQSPKFWNIASTGEDTGEILLYGDVMERQPVDWWTGEPVPGLFVTPEGFLEDLEAVKGKSSVTVKINSCGGDLYTGIAIHNALKGLAGKKTVIVEGIAASAASVIMCAGDEVQVYPGSMVMIHGVAGCLDGFYTAADLKKIQKEIDASEHAIAEIYHAKSGLEVDQLRTMMTRETWMIGQEAVDNGFADAVLDDKELDAALSADKKTLLVAGVRHDVSAFKHLPGTIPTRNGITAAPAAGDITAAQAKTTKEENQTMTLEELKAKHPELVAQIEEQALKNAGTKAIEQERERIKAIESIEKSVGDADLVNDAKYVNPCTAERLALKAMQKQAALGTQHLANVAADNAASNAQSVGAAPNGGEENDNDDAAKVGALVNFVNATRNGGTKK